MELVAPCACCGLLIRGENMAQQGLIDESSQHTQRRAADGLGSLARKATPKDSQLAEHARLVLAQQTPRPGKDCTDAALPFRQIAMVNGEKIDAPFDLIGDFVQ